MKYIASTLLVVLLLFGCGSDDTENVTQSNLPAQTLTDVPYGPNSEQIMDVYLPANRGSNTKVFVLVHGGYWTEGSKADMDYIVTLLKTSFPDHAIVNIDYRLATAESPGFPKQIDDLGLALTATQQNNYNISSDFALIGTSAGAHLSLLYAYSVNTGNHVKAVCSIVGPTDFTDPAYVNNPAFQMGLIPLVGNVSYSENPAIFAQVSPAIQVSEDAPPTIMFYGGQDELIPVSQGTRLQDKLNRNGVYNEYYLYPNAGHGTFDLADLFDLQTKLAAFMTAKF